MVKIFSRKLYTFHSAYNQQSLQAEGSLPYQVAHLNRAAPPPTAGCISSALAISQTLVARRSGLGRPFTACAASAVAAAPSRSSLLHQSVRPTDNIIVSTHNSHLTVKHHITVSHNSFMCLGKCSSSCSRRRHVSTLSNVIAVGVGAHSLASRPAALFRPVCNRLHVNHCMLNVVE